MELILLKCLGSFLKSFCGHMSLLGATDPCFVFLMTSLLGFKARQGFCLIHFFCRGECNVHSPRFTSGATCADLFKAGSTASYFPTCISRGRTWLGFKQAITRTKHKSATIVPATRLKCFGSFELDLCLIAGD